MGRSPSRGKSTLQWTEKVPHCCGHHQLLRLCFLQVCQPLFLLGIFAQAHFPLLCSALHHVTPNSIFWPSHMRVETPWTRAVFPAFSGTEPLILVSHTYILQCSCLESICMPVMWLTFPRKHPPGSLYNIFIHGYIELQGTSPTCDIRETFLFFYS